MEGVLRTSLELHVGLVFGLAVLPLVAMLTVVMVLVPSLRLNLWAASRAFCLIC
jgi:hypothetical protein